MDYQPQVTFRSDPRYQQALHDFQRGKWRTGLDRLRQVQEDFPLEQELRSLSAEMQLRAKIDYDEQIDRRVDARRRFVRISTRVAVGVLLVLVVFFGVGAYASAIQRQWDSARAALETEARSLELAQRLKEQLEALEHCKVLNAGTTGPGVVWWVLPKGRNAKDIFARLESGELPPEKFAGYAAEIRRPPRASSVRASRGRSNTTR